MVLLTQLIRTSYQIQPYKPSKTQELWNHSLFRFHTTTHHQAQPQFDLHVTGPSGIDILLQTCQPNQPTTNREGAHLAIFDHTLATFAGKY